MIEYTEEMYLQVNKLIKYFLKKYMSRSYSLHSHFDELYSDCHYLFFNYYIKYKSDAENNLYNVFYKDFDYDEFFNYNYLLSLCNEAIKNEKPSYKKIMEDILKEEKPIRIAEKYNVSRQFVNQCCEKLKMLVFLKLKQNNYDSVYLKNYKPDIEKIPFKYREEIKKYL